MSYPVVTLESVSKHYKHLRALDGINLTLNSGEIMGLFGHNGAGKTTMMKLILGVITVSDGQIKVCGVDPKSKQAWNSRKEIGYLPENVSFYEQLTGHEVLTYFARLKSVPKGQVSPLLEKVGLSSAMHRQVKTYSKGMRQRLGLAQAFLGKPTLLLLDEPTVGLDPIATQEFYLSVNQLRNEGASIILCSHVLPGVEQHIDRAMILSNGKSIAIGTLDELRQQANLPVVIKTQGINGALGQNENLSQFIVDATQLHIPQELKVNVLKQLLDYDSLDDIQVENANLEQIYQYYLRMAAGENNQNSKGAI